MATPITGQISVSDVNTALGRSSTASFSFNDSTFQLMTNQGSTNVDLNNAHASAYINSTVTNYNVYTSTFGSPATVTTYKVLIGASGVAGATSTGNYALNVGQFPSGSSVVLNNYGTIAGAGGATNSGTGGPALYSAYANQTVTINNLSLIHI